MDKKHEYKERRDSRGSLRHSEGSNPYMSRKRNSYDNLLDLDSQMAITDNHQKLITKAPISTEICILQFQSTIQNTPNLNTQTTLNINTIQRRSLQKKQSTIQTR